MPSPSLRARPRPAAALQALALAGVLAGVVAFAAAAEAAHPHYEQLLEKGTYSLERGEAAEAARLLRLACFGMLEEPPALADCLVRLGLAHAADGDDEAFADAFRRLVDLEERFGAYAEASMPEGLRSAFEAEAATRIPARILSETPTFARLVPAPEEPPPAADVQAPVGPLAPTTPPTGADASDALAPQDEERLAQARLLLASARDRAALEEPSRIAREVADAHPGSREAQHLAAVIAYRAARWDEAVRYFRRGGDPGEASAETLFYLAVSLYEVGEREAAAEALRRSLPRIERTPFVRSYEEKILEDRPAAGADLPGGGMR